MKGARIVVAWGIALSALGGAWAGDQGQGTDKPKDKKEKKQVLEQFEGTLVTMSGPTAAGLGQPVTVWVEEWTSDDVVKTLAKTLSEKGQPALRDALGELNVGRLRIGTSLGYPLSVARQFTTPEGRVIRFATNRPLQGFELNKGSRSQDYPIAFIELKLKPDGTGDGVAIGMAKVAFDENNRLTISSYGTSPAKLTNVRATDRKD